MRQEEIQVGDRIFYKLLPSDSPNNPDEEYRALVKRKKCIEPDIWMFYVQALGEGFYEDSTKEILIGSVVYYNLIDSASRESVPCYISKVNASSKEGLLSRRQS